MAKEHRKMDSLQSAPDFYLNAPLYTPYAFTNDEDAKVDGPDGIIYFPGPLNSFCIACQEPSIFRDPNALRRLPQPMVEGTFAGLGERVALRQQTVFKRWFHCARNSAHEHQLFFVFRIEWQAERVMKVGQYPSLADLATTEIKQYQKLLGPELYRELSKGIGLAAHGVGIGAFVYLRRILENLIEAAHQAAHSSRGWKESAYTNAHVDEKIRLLRDYLPPFIVENRTLYSILSKGIHELNEQECLLAFPLMKFGIEFILDQKLEAQEREAKAAQASKDIAALHSQIKASGKGR